MAKIQDVEIPSLLFAEQGSDPAAPAAGFWRLYYKSGGIYLRSSAGTVVGPLGTGGGGSGTVDVVSNVATERILGRLTAGSGDSEELTAAQVRGLLNAAVTVEDVTGTSDTIATADLGKFLRYTNAALVTVTLPDGLAVGSIVHLLFTGAAGGTIQSNGTSTVTGSGAVAQNGEASCLVTATNTWHVVRT